AFPNGSARPLGLFPGRGHEHLWRPAGFGPTSRVRARSDASQHGDYRFARSLLFHVTAARLRARASHLLATYDDDDFSSNRFVFVLFKKGAGGFCRNCLGKCKGVRALKIRDISCILLPRYICCVFDRRRLCKAIWARPAILRQLAETDRRCRDWYLRG